jgi:peptidoglycan/xylan/chitin deacetylase (PgdA/CDA1 family)
MNHYNGKKTIKRLIKLSISLLVFLFDQMAGWIQGCFKIKKKASCNILYYHTVYFNETNAFARQMDSLLRWTIPIRLNEISSKRQEGRYAAVTFDDGFVCVIEYALPILAKRKIPTTLFVPSAILGQEAPWLPKETEARKDVVMTEDQLINLDKELVSIGSHGRFHKNLSEISLTEAEDEIFLSKKELEDILGVPTETVSFPYGEFEKTHLRMAVQAGYKKAYSILPARIALGRENFLVGRVKVDPADWHMEFVLKTLGAYRWLPVAFEIKRRISSFKM